MTDIVTPPSMTEPPDAPLTTDTRTDFSTKAFNLVAWFITLVTEMSAALANVFNNATAAHERAQAAATSATTAAGHVTSAATQAGLAATARNQAEAFAQSAILAPGTSGTSASSVAVGSGTKTFATQTGKNFPANGGIPVVASRSSDPTGVRMWGTLVSYNSATGAFVMSVGGNAFKGSGTFSDWTLSITGPQGAPGILPVVPISTNTVGVAGFCYYLTASCTLTAPPLGTTDEEFEFRDVSGTGTAAVDFGATKVTTITGIKTPGLMTLEPYTGRRLRSSGNPTTGYLG